eukprot:13136247-Alexandrium_andersonii.AAC.1
MRPFGASRTTLNAAPGPAQLKLGAPEAIVHVQSVPSTPSASNAPSAPSAPSALNRGSAPGGRALM